MADNEEEERNLCLLARSIGPEQPPPETLKLINAIPPRNLGGGPLPWEETEGGLVARCAKMGWHSIKFTKKFYPESRIEVNGEAQAKVRELGARALELLHENEVPYSPTPAVETKASKKLAHLMRRRARRQEREKEGFDDDLFVETSYQRIALDWNTKNYSKHDILGSCSFLIDEAKRTFDSRKRKLSLIMLEILVKRHHQARSFVGGALEGLVREAFPHFTWAMNQYTFQTAYILEGLAGYFANELTMYNIIDRMLCFVLRESSLAARILQHRSGYRKLHKKVKGYPLEVKARILLGYNMISNDLNKQWRQMHSTEHGGTVPPWALATHLGILKQLTTSGSTKFFRVNRRRVVEAGGLLVIGNTLRSEIREMEMASSGLLLEIAEEPILLRPILEAQLVENLRCKLDDARSIHQEILHALEILERLAMSAHLYSERIRDPSSSSSSYRFDEFVARGEKSMKRKAEAIFDETPMKTRTGLEDTLTNCFLSSAVVEAIIKVMMVGPNEVFLRSTLVLHRMACTIGYEVVLENVLNTGGKCMQNIVDGLESTDRRVRMACLGLFQQLASTGEGRLMMTGKGVTKMVLNLCSGGGVEESELYMLGLRCLCALVYSGQDLIARPEDLELDDSSELIREKTYSDFVGLVSAGDEATQKSAKELWRIEGLPTIVRFLVRYGDIALAGPNRHRTCIFLHHILISKRIIGVVIDWKSRRVYEYLGRVATRNTIDLVDRRLGTSKDPDAEKLMCMGMRSCFLAMVVLAKHSQESYNTMVEVVLKLNLLSDLRVVVEKAAKLKPIEFDPHVLGVYEASMNLLEAITPLPVHETVRAADLEPEEDSVTSEARCLPLLERMLKTFHPPLVEIIGKTESTLLLSSALKSLTRFSTTTTTCKMLLDLGIIEILSSMISREPSLLEAPQILNGASLINTLRLEGGNGVASGVKVLMVLPASFFGFLASIARFLGCRQRLQEKLFLRRAIERLHLATGDLIHDAKVSEEIFVLLARMAHVYTPGLGQSNDLILSEKFCVVRILATAISAGSSREMRYTALTACCSLMRDVLRAIPIFVRHGLLAELVIILSDKKAPHPILRRALECLSLAVGHPNKLYHEQLLKTDLRSHLFRIVNSRTFHSRRKGDISIGDVASEVIRSLDHRGGNHEKCGALLEDGSTLGHDGALGSSDIPVSPFDISINDVPSVEGLVATILPLHALKVPAGGIFDCGVTQCGNLDTQETELGFHIMPEQGDTDVISKAPIGKAANQDSSYRSCGRPNPEQRKISYTGMVGGKGQDLLLTKDYKVARPLAFEAKLPSRALPYKAKASKIDPSSRDMVWRYYYKEAVLHKKNKKTRKVVDLFALPQMVSTRPPGRPATVEASEKTIPMAETLVPSFSDKFLVVQEEKNCLRPMKCTVTLDGQMLMDDPVFFNDGSARDVKSTRRVVAEDSEEFVHHSSFGDHFVEVRSVRTRQQQVSY